jgi:hypothetical protein
MQLNGVGDVMRFTSRCWPGSANQPGRSQRSTQAPGVGEATGAIADCPSCYGGAGSSGAPPPAKKTTAHKAFGVTCAARTCHLVSSA